MHRDAHAVLHFWFEECVPEQHFTKDEAFDRTLAERFGDLRASVIASEAAEWRDDRDSLLAAIILLDQFGRNIHRGEARAFAADPLALTLSHLMVARGWDRELPAERKPFAYLPFEHAEDATAQAESVRLFEALGDPERLKYAQDHAAVIEEFGRFPSRNAALGRATTAEEMAYLSRPDAGW